jgi:2-polyprenyl-3-methyl-5-hydroxy-6-metoxy-1,4-benzoquinol methylase
VVVTPETPVQRSAREGRRALFDGVAGRYDISRPGYPAELVDEVVASAAAGPGATVLEIGCGTGQLTRQLTGRGFELTAIDIGASVLGVERTRATFLSWPEPDQAAFTADLEALLDRAVPIDVVQETFLAMAPTAA